MANTQSILLVAVCVIAVVGGGGLLYYTWWIANKIDMHEYNIDATQEVMNILHSECKRQKQEIEALKLETAILQNQINDLQK